MNKRLYIADAIAKHSLNDGLVSRWQALPGQQRGVMFRDLCGKNHGTLTSGPLWTGPLGRPGGFGALSLDGTDDWVDATFLGIASATEFTVSLWAKIASGQGSFQRIWSAGFDSYIELVTQTNYGTDHVELRPGNTGPTIDGGVVADNTWHHFVATRTGTTVSLYVDGLPVGTPLTFSATFDSLGSFRLGDIRGGINGGYGPPMQADDLRIYARALSDLEVASVYTASRQQYDPTLNWIKPRYVFDVGGGGGGSPTFNYLPLLGVG